ncbi:MAG: murein biosynthesis integral membrane protein MurJ [Thiotrichales bacterium TMED285]|nr:MAG: murein biosynthesis integral membrane protein MurJ [Thiotrichales bacterium TMED285]
MRISRFWKSTFGFSFLTLLSRIFGYLRDLVISSSLGASTIHDIFVVVFRIPNVFRSFFAEGAMSQSLVPSIIEANKNVKSLLNQIFTLLVVSLLLFVTVVEIFPESFVRVFAPGFVADDQKFSDSVAFLRIIFPYIFLISLVAFFGAIQNSKKHFQVFAATPIIFNLSLIIFALNAEQLDLRIIGTSILVAGSLQLLLNTVFSFQLRYFPRLVFSLKKNQLSSFFNRFVPAIFATGVYQLNILVDTVFASFLVTGSPTWLYLSERLVQFPLGLFGVAIAIVSLPDLAETFSKRNFKIFKERSNRAILALSIIGFTSFIFLAFFSQEVIRLLFERGQFNALDTVNTANSLIAYSVALPFLMYNKFYNSVFFAISRTDLVLKLGILSLLLNLIFNYLFIFVLHFSHVGLALATSISVFLVFLTAQILVYLNENLRDKKILNIIFTSTCATFAAGGFLL